MVSICRENCSGCSSGRFGLKGKIPAQIWTPPSPTVKAPCGVMALTFPERFASRLCITIGF